MKAAYASAIVDLLVASGARLDDDAQANLQASLTAAIVGHASFDHDVIRRGMAEIRFAQRTSEVSVTFQFAAGDDPREAMKLAAFHVRIAGVAAACAELLTASRVDGAKARP